MDSSELIEYLRYLNGGQRPKRGYLHDRVIIDTTIKRLTTVQEICDKWDKENRWQFL